MKELVTSKQMQEYDAYTINNIGIPSLVLMERAALGVLEELLKEEYPKKKILVICGIGNNGADGLAIARLLKEQNFNVYVKIIGSNSQMTEEAKIQYKLAQKFQVSFVQDIRINEYTTIVDAIFGIGLKRSVIGKFQEVIEKVNQSGIPVVSVDIPSGIDGTTGAVLGCGVRATTTVTFSFEKMGQYLEPGRSFCGKLICKEVGIVKAQDKLYDVYNTLEKKDLSKIPKRISGGNKGSFGKVLLIAGSESICGAAYLSAMAAFRCGIGMLKIVTHERNKDILTAMLPEAMITTYNQDTLDLSLLKSDYQWADVIGIGPGLSDSQRAEEILSFILEHSKKPLVIDADGLNLLAKGKDRLKDYPNTCILTPHLGEMARLVSKSIDEVLENKEQIAKEFAEEYQVTLVLKNPKTYIHVKGLYRYINLSGNEGMATAGSGDVLTGILLGMLTKGIDKSLEAALGVYIHGLLGDIAKEELGSSFMLATDLIKAIPKILE